MLSPKIPNISVKIPSLKTKIKKINSKNMDKCEEQLLQNDTTNTIMMIIQNPSANIEHHDDKYTANILKKRFSNFKITYLSDCELINNGLPIRHQNTPEDITENLTKFIIRKFENDKSCVWCKGVDKKYGLVGDLYSNKYEKTMPIEVKSMTSNGPSQFGPNKKFSVLYFLDLRDWINDKIILWKVNLNYTDTKFKNIKVNKTQTLEDQLLEGRRPHICWNKIYSQISEDCLKIYDGTFENIF